MAYDVFISYAHKDKQIAEAISAALAAERISCVIAPRGAATLTTEQSMVACEVLSQSRLMMLLLTANANRFVSLIRELEHAVKKGIPVVPVCLEGTVIDPSIQQIIGPPIATLTDVAVWQLRELASEIKDRLEKIKQQLQKPTRPPADERRFCFHCGSALRSGAKFCPHCGTQQRTFASRGEFPAPINAKQPARESSASAEPRANSGEGATLARPLPPPESRSHHAPVDPALLAPTDRFADFPRNLPQSRPRFATDPQSDALDCTLYSRSEAQQGESLFIQVFAHLPEQAGEAGRLAREFDSDAARRGFKNLETEIRRGSLLVFHLSLPGMKIADPVQSLVWRGAPASVQFEAIVPAHAGLGTFIGTLTVSQDSVPVGHIKFRIKIVARDQMRLPQVAEPVGQSRAYKKAFISYASPDRAEVLKRVQMLARLKINFFQDVLALEPGARWEREIYRRIDESDLFLLFWSRAARESRQVMEEVRYALRRKNGDEMAAPEILPVIIEGPPPAAPPPELAHLHFNDYFLYFIAAQSGLTKNF
jgi:hypothetical protein